MSPKILFLDIETAPDLVYTWGVYEQNAIAVKEHWYILSFAAKWLGKKAEVVGLNDVEGREEDLLLNIWNLLDAADIVVAHNGADFDIKKINTRFIVHGLTPPSPYKVVDTKREAKKAAAFSSNKLDWLCKQLEIGKKIEHEGFSLWEGCMANDPACWKRMKRYNLHDVILLEKLYNHLLPWMKQPNAMMWGQKCVTPGCGSTRIQARGMARTKTRSYQRYQCMGCGVWSREVLSEAAPRAGRVGL